MAELDLLRSLPLEVSEPSAQVRGRAKTRLLRHVQSAPATRRRLLLAAVALLGAAAGAGALIGVGSHDHGNASAAPALRRAANVARRQAPPPPLTPGHFRYTKSVQAFLVIDGDRNGWVALGPKVREIWIGPTGGLLRERSGTAQFLSARDREHWIAAGRPQVNPPVTVEKLPPARPLDLPKDPDALYATLYARVSGYGYDANAEMLGQIGDALRETDTPPSVRASLYEVAARIPGIELVGHVLDRFGRRGVAVAYSDTTRHQRQELIFDPKTSALLEEDYVALDGNEFGYPAGTNIGYATYVASAVVDRLGARP